MSVDKAREHDLEELYNLYKAAPTRAERQEYERIINKIMRESGAVRARREELIDAIRGGDRRHVRYVQEELRIIEKKEKGGLESIKI